MDWKQYKRARKTAIKTRGSRAGEYIVHEVTCPFCNVTMGGDFHNTLMYSCHNCHNPIDLRGSDGKQVFEEI